MGMNKNAYETLSRKPEWKRSWKRWT